MSYDSRGKPCQRYRLHPNAVPTLYLDHYSDEFKDYRTAEIAKEKQMLKKSNNDNKNFLIFKCKFCERSYTEGKMFRKHLSEAHKVYGPEISNDNNGKVISYIKLRDFK